MSTSNDSSISPNEIIAEENALQRVYTPLLLLAAGAFILLIVAVFGFNRYGMTFAERLSGQLGDIEAARALSLSESGLVGNAIAAYEKALSMRFEDPDQRRWALRRFAELLVRENRPDEAVVQLRVCLKEWPDYLPAHVLLCQVLSATGKGKPLADAARAWAAVTEKSPENRAVAFFYEGEAHEMLGQAEEARIAYEEGHKIWPKGRCGYRAAKLLYARGDAPNALRILEEFLNQKPEDIGAAQALRDEIAAGMEGGAARE